MQLLGSDTIANGTLEFRFTKPEGFQYRAGQSVDLTLQSQLMHPYSLASAPHEDHLTVVTRMRDSAYKKELKSLMINSAVTIDGPFGSFFLHDKVERPAVFLVGGIGVTPFYSILKDATERALPHQIYMLYGNKTREDAPYIAELEALSAMHQSFALKNVLGDRITADTVTAFAPTDKNPVYYMAGPVGMVTAMRSILTSLGVSDDDIRFEEFSGY
jgi:ferredoxin-NADP reductase